MTERDLHEAAKAKILDPSRRCTGAFAKDADGQIVEARSPEAVRWCAGGAILACAPAEEVHGRDGDVEEWSRVMWTGSTALRAYTRLFRIAGTQADEEDGDFVDTLADYNDYYAHRRVIALFDRAFAGCAAEELTE